MTHDGLKKMKIKAPHALLCLHAPESFEPTVLAAGLTLVESGGNAFDSLHWFVKTRADVENSLPEVLRLLKPGLPVWVYYPKGGSGIQTDLNRDKGWDALVQREDVRWMSMISFDATWTAFCFRLKTEQDKKEDARPKEERAIFQYADSKTKTIILPDDLNAALQAHPLEQGIFNQLSFSNRREYVEWVITAKQDNTRKARVEGTLERLRKGFKNPAGR